MTKQGDNIIPALSDRYDELPTLPAAYALLAMQNALIGRVTPRVLIYAAEDASAHLSNLVPLLGSNLCLMHVPVSPTFSLTQL